LKEQNVLLKDGEAFVVHHHRYLSNADTEPPSHVVVRSAPEVTLNLAGKPSVVKDAETNAHRRPATVCVCYGRPWPLETICFSGGLTEVE
jgi:hypothetical protein